jgi:hypothetical protein
LRLMKINLQALELQNLFGSGTRSAPTTRSVAGCLPTDAALDRCQMFSDYGRGFALAAARVCWTKARTQSETGMAPRDAAPHYKVGTDAIAGRSNRSLQRKGRREPSGSRLLRPNKSRRGPRQPKRPKPRGVQLPTAPVFPRLSDYFLPIQGEIQSELHRQLS